MYLRSRTFKNLRAGTLAFKRSYLFLTPYIYVADVHRKRLIFRPYTRFLQPLQQKQTTRSFVTVWYYFCLENHESYFVYHGLVAHACGRLFAAGFCYFSSDACPDKGSDKDSDESTQ
jgi:hypothetical protein